MGIAGAEIAEFVAATVAASGQPGRVVEAVEEAARRAMGRIGQAMIENAVAMHVHQVGPVPSCPTCSGPVVAKGVRQKTVRTLSGPVRVRRPWSHCPACRSGFAPADEALGLTTTVSPALAKAYAMAGMDLPFGHAAALVHEVAAIAVSASTLARSCRAAGQRAKARADAETTASQTAVVSYLPPAGPAPSIGYVLMDGTGAPMVPAETQQRVGKAADGRAHTREVKIGLLFTQTQRDKDGAPIRDPGSNSYIATFDDADHFADELTMEYIRRGFYRARQLIVIGDGAKWIWNLADRCWPEATQIVDYYHAAEHVHDLVSMIDHVLARPGELIDQLLSHLERGDTPAMAATIDALHLHPHLAAKTDKAIDYFTRNTRRMQYHHYREKGWFIGSGQVESACKTIVAQRAKQSGMRWTINGLTPILTLRTLHRSDRDYLIWEENLSQTPLTQAA